MKFTCKRTELYEKIMNVQRTVSTKTTVPALEGILLKVYDGKLNLCSYNLEVGTTTDMEVNVIEDGEIVVMAKLFVDAVNKLPDENVEISTNDKLIMFITSGSVNYQLVGMSAIEFPDLPTYETKTSIKVNAETIKNMIKQVRFAISDDTRKPVYTGALFEINDKIFTMVAIDGFKMAVRREAINDEGTASLIVPGKTLSEVLKFNTDEKEDIELIIGQRHITFKIKDYYLVSRLLDGAFMDYNSVLPKGFTTELTIKRNILTQAIERMSIVGFEKIASPLTCCIEKNCIKFSSVTSIGRADEILYINTNGEELTIGFNNKYLLEALRNTDTDEVKLEFNGARSPLKILPVEGDLFLYIVLPMRL